MVLAQDSTKWDQTQDCEIVKENLDSLSQSAPTIKVNSKKHLKQSGWTATFLTTLM